MHLVKRNKIYHLFYKDENNKLQSVSTKCQRKADANKFAVQYLQQLKKNSKKETILKRRLFLRMENSGISIKPMHHPDSLKATKNLLDMPFSSSKGLSGRKSC